jgi:hypothetical protein
MGNKPSSDQGPAINMAPPEDRPSGRYITAKDLAERLLGELHANEFLLWPPDLFAYTSYIMQKTAAYQLVVSPPSKKNLAANQNRADGMALRRGAGRPF